HLSVRSILIHTSYVSYSESPCHSPTRVLPFFSLIKRRPPISTLFPYTTLFRSLEREENPKIKTGIAFLIYVNGFKPANLIRFAGDRKSTRLNSSHVSISYAVFCLKKKSKRQCHANERTRRS